MILHPLSPEVKCQTCGEELEFVRVRRFADLYQCAHGAKACGAAVLHYRKARTTTCGWARVMETGYQDTWNESAGPAAAKGE
jgi:hypothetical protein